MNCIIETFKIRFLFLREKGVIVYRKTRILYAMICITATITSCCFHGEKQEDSTLFDGAENIDIELKADDQQVNSHNSTNVEFSDFKLIPLQNCEDSYLKQITKMQVCDSGFYVYSERESVILRFRHNGEFASRIGEKGHGHGEYSEIITFCANNAGDSIYVMSYDGIKIFDHNGNFIKNINNFNTGLWQGFLSTFAGVFLSTNNRVGDVVITRYDRNIQYATPIMEAPQDIIRNYPSSWRNQLQADGSILCYFDFYTSTFYIFDLNNMKKCKSYSLHSANILTEKWIRERPKDQIDANGSDHLESYVIEDHAIWGIFNYDGRPYNFKLDLNNDSCSLNSIIDLPYSFLDAYKGDYYLYYDSSSLLDMLSPQPQLFCKQTIELFKDALEPYRNHIKETDNFYILKMHRREGK